MASDDSGRVEVSFLGAPGVGEESGSRSSMPLSSGGRLTSVLSSGLNSGASLTDLSKPSSISMSSSSPEASPGDSEPRAMVCDTPEGPPAGRNRAIAGTIISGSVISSVDSRPLREESIPATPGHVFTASPSAVPAGVYVPMEFPAIAVFGFPVDGGGR
ncbi:MAG TPA: hypothetical protein DC058_03345 [Planctomycetaceae bacterium]|nr:hypothetical protein [Planctomycetaceae bacterium]